MDVRAITFAGSTRTDQVIQAAAAKPNLKNTIFELGGKSPTVIFENAELETAVAETQCSIQFNSGQACIANSRIYVQDTIAGRFIALFKEKFSAVSAGYPTRKETNHGPVADEIQYNTVKDYIKLGKQWGEMDLGEEGE
ncbi:aldehyde dehydrogenase [Zopfia rhizophila CBS 207.26]|uniref:aldehyde dehydrogenase (NAD(+)) n=1 Tax=Zopfia rhizophila CBS 207.26 TaxID=1314779 RepID=A0A6A6D9S3_9PEZI|nr:aldehyde dehydrogenase [Zopfia rhizophila CBS 207.26]